MLSFLLVSTEAINKTQSEDNYEGQVPSEAESSSLSPDVENTGAANSTGKMLSKASAGDILVGARLAHEMPEDLKSGLVKWDSPVESGFVYRSDLRHYYYYPYDGRWTK